MSQFEQIRNEIDNIEFLQDDYTKKVFLVGIITTSRQEHRATKIFFKSHGMLSCLDVEEEFDDLPFDSFVKSWDCTYKELPYPKLSDYIQKEGNDYGEYKSAFIPLERKKMEFKKDFGFFASDYFRIDYDDDAYGYSSLTSISKDKLKEVELKDFFDILIDNSTLDDIIKEAKASIKSIDKNNLVQEER